MSDTMKQVPKDHPMHVAWDQYKQTDDFANSKHWASYPGHVDGSLWAAFTAGYVASVDAFLAARKDTPDEH